MEKPLNFLSETARWETASEFTTPNGVISKGTGESLIEINERGITNKSWALINKKKIENNYVIHKVTENRYEYTSTLIFTIALIGITMLVCIGINLLFFSAQPRTQKVAHIRNYRYIQTESP